ncbi:ATP-grasp domain-containing protein [Niallia sp. XMNu-256]|uniref:ATP-grasp domain-containing protein n=1 Tax=Niallia sp. XMNu-256 TaxID=3082444 RepID=UPI0030D4F342
MRTIIFLHTMKSGSSREAIRAAEKLGYFTVLFTDNEKLLTQRTEFPDVHQMTLVDLSNMEELRNRIKKSQSQGLIIDAIVSFVDPYVYLATKLHGEFCNNRLSIEAIRAMEDKILTREKLKDSPYTPKFIKINGRESKESLTSLLKDYSYPLMVKSPYSTGSKDVIKVENDKQLFNSVNMLTNKYPDVPVLIEEYLDGPQFLVETVVLDGKVHIIAIIEQEITQFKRFIITGYNVLKKMDKTLLQNMKQAVERIIQSFEMKTGTCHLEIRVVRGQCKLVEINPRISGGAMNRMIDIAYGINLVEETLKLSLGTPPNLTRKWVKPVFTQYVTISTSGILERVTGKKRASRSPGVQEVYIKPRKGKLLSPPKTMGQRYAYVIATGDSSEQAKENAKTAAKEIQFHLIPVSLHE